jgi:LuxR family transcriptional regulator, maltose regulon positive regulatory protein
VTERRDPATPAPLFRRHTRRPRLTSLLDETKAQSILLTAPAGYGKTTLAQEWLQGRDHVAWYRATSASADLAAFSAGLADVIAPILPGTGNRLKQRLRVGDAPERAVRPLAELLAEDLAEWPEDGIIVVDDYHLVTDSVPVEDFVDWLLTLVPVRMLITTRRRPAWALARRVLYGEITEIGPEQLAMNDEEASRVLEGRPSESVRMLVRQAHGWPALIGLAALSATLELPEERVSDALFRYFAEEVLQREPAEVQRFMVLASVPSALSTRLARDVLGFPDAEAILSRLKTENILHDSDGLVFHPLLRDYLQRKFQNDDPKDFEMRAEQVIADACEFQRWDEAFGLLLQLGHEDRAAAIVALAAGDLLAHGRVETLGKWLDRSAPASLHLPSTQLVKAELLAHRGEISEAIALASQVANRLQVDDPQSVRAWNLTGRALHLASREDEAFESYQTARRLATTPKETKEALWGLFLSANEIAPHESVQYLDELEALSSGDIDTQLRLAVGRQFAAEQQGNLAGLWSRYRSLVDSVQHATDPLARTSFLANYAAMNVSRGDYALAENLADQALHLCRELNLRFAIGACLGFRGGAEVGLRKFRRAERTLMEFAKTTARREDPYFQYLELTLRVKLAISTGRAALALETQSLAPRGAVSRRGRGEYLATLAIAAAAAGEPALARQLAAEAKGLACSVEAVHCSAIAGAIAAVGIRADAESLAALEQVVLTSIEADFRDGVVIAYRAWPPLLRLVQSPALVSHLRDTIELSNDQTLGRRAGLLSPEEEAASDVDSLTPRELQVLELLAAGLSNREIARQLFISHSTAKVHVHHILEKLDVKSRLQAVLKARALLDRD